MITQIPINRLVCILHCALEDWNTDSLNGYIVTYLCCLWNTDSLNGPYICIYIAGISHGDDVSGSANVFSVSCFVIFFLLQQDKEKLEQKLHDMAVMVERLESSRQKLLMEVLYLLSLVHLELTK